MPQNANVGPVKSGVIAEAGLDSGILGIHAAGQKLLGQADSFMQQIIKHRGAGSLAENAIQVMLADKKFLGNLVQCYIFF